MPILNYPGKYIVIEGGEGCGKSKQADLLEQYFNEKKVPNIRVREPGGVPSAESIRKIVKDKSLSLEHITELFLFEAARTELFAKKSIPALKEGKIVLSDRSGDATKAYQGYGDGIDQHWINWMNMQATFGISPDVAIIIDINPEVGLARETHPDAFAAKGLEYHKRVNEGYRKIAQEHLDTHILIKYQDGSIDSMQNLIRAHVNTKLKKFLSQYIPSNGYVVENNSQPKKQ